MANPNQDLSPDELSQLENALEAGYEHPQFVNGGDLLNVVHIILKRFAPAGYKLPNDNFPSELTSKASRPAEIPLVPAATADVEIDTDIEPDPEPEVKTKAETQSPSKSITKGSTGNKPKSAAERALAAAKG